MKLCECGCGELIPDINTHDKPARFKTHHNIKFIRKAKIGHRVKHMRGYILIKQPDHPRSNNQGYVLEHIVIWEIYNKACLLCWSNIHHIDGNRQNNDPLNIIAMMSRDHHRLHVKRLGRDENGHWKKRNGRTKV